MLDIVLLLEIVQSLLIYQMKIPIVLDGKMEYASHVQHSAGEMEIDAFLSIQCVLKQILLMEIVFLVILDIFYQQENVF